MTDDELERQASEDAASLWFPLARAVMAADDGTGEIEEAPEAETAPPPRRRFPSLTWKRTPRRARAPGRPPETPSVRANRLALAATSGDWDTVPEMDRDLLRRALGSDPSFKGMLSALDRAPPPRPTPTSTGGDGIGTTDADGFPGFVFSLEPMPTENTPAMHGPDATRAPVPSVHVTRDQEPFAHVVDLPSPRPLWEVDDEGVSVRGEAAQDPSTEAAPTVHERPDPDVTAPPPPVDNAEDDTHAADAPDDTRAVQGWLAPPAPPPTLGCSTKRGDPEWTDDPFPPIPGRPAIATEWNPPAPSPATPPRSEGGTTPILDPTPMIVAPSTPSGDIKSEAATVTQLEIPAIASAREVVRVAWVRMDAVPGRDAPVVARLRLHDGGEVSLREIDGKLHRPLLGTGSLAPVDVDGLLALLKESAVADMAEAGDLVVVDGTIHRPTGAPLLHVACLRGLKPLGRDGGWLQPRPGDGYRLAWRFPDGLGSFGDDGSPGRRSHVVTWDLAQDPGPVSGMSTKPRPGITAVAVGLTHARDFLDMAREACADLRPSRPDLPWHVDDLPVDILADGGRHFPGPTLAEAMARIGGEGVRAAICRQALSSAAGLTTDDGMQARLELGPG